MSGGRKRITTRLGSSTADSITVRGLDLVGDIIGKVSLGDMAFLELKGRLPSPEESTVFNAIAVTLVEHGLTPSAVASRVTLYGAPESLQGAVAAGILGMGDRFGGSIEDAARTLQEASPGEDPAALARAIVESHRSAHRIIAGVGHPIHRVADPRTPRLFAVAAENGFSGRFVQLIQLISEEATRAYGRSLPVNATGAIAAVASELGISWRAARGIAVMARAIGLVAHVQEEMEDPIAGEILSRIED
ncbi:MAG TPA: citryl-CoA lyase [Candidatus Dormibacteraeota bacterium]